jgi:NO-binding membrane sensor protein with MHYT domain
MLDCGIRAMRNATYADLRPFRRRYRFPIHGRNAAYGRLTRRGVRVPISYNAWLVSLSLAVAVLASLTSLRLAARVAESPGAAGRAWLILGAISMGAGIWAMHYMGMSAISIVPAISYDPALLAASIAIAVTASYVALWLTFRLRSGTHRYLWVARLAAAIVMGAAIASMHYTAMAASIIQPGAFCRSGLALNDRWVAISVAIAALGLLTITLVTSIFDARLAARARQHALRLEQANARLRHQATHDPLTDLPNRALFIEWLRRAIQAPGSENAAFAVKLVDLDRFKAVNDSLGHSFGDAIL